LSRTEDPDQVKLGSLYGERVNLDTAGRINDAIPSPQENSLQMKKFKRQIQIRKSAHHPLQDHGELKQST
jgi:hypothetical protein